jgi:DNA-binding transcriptional LysR family regulator
MALELRHFRYFVAVAEEGHITRAAERLGMQQPPLSQRIRFIEDELGAQLFLRRARGVELTPAGRAFLEIARSMLSQYESAYETVRRAARGQTGRLCVGATPTSAFHPIVPLAIRAFRDEFPHVNLTLEERLPAELIKGLEEENIDVAFLRAETFEEGWLSVRPLLAEPMITALPTGHRLARLNRAIALRDLARDTFIVYARQTGPAFFEATIAACREAGFSPTLGQEAPRGHVSPEPGGRRSWRVRCADLRQTDGNGGHRLPPAQGAETAEGANQYCFTPRRPSRCSPQLPKLGQESEGVTRRRKMTASGHQPTWRRQLVMSVPTLEADIRGCV